MAKFNIQLATTIHNIDTEIWDRLSDGHPFQSHRWYVFGEKVMSDCNPFYLLVRDGDEMIGRACFWLIRNEPLPLDMPVPFKKLISGLLRHWPLLICRSPMANTSGYVLPPGLRRTSAMGAIIETIMKIAKEQKVSFVLFDYLSDSDLNDMPSDIIKIEVSNPGTIMENHWNSLDEYLKSGNKRDRQHYKRSLREADKLGIRVTAHRTVPDVDAALALIREVENRHDNIPNPWMRALLENMNLVDGIWLEARIEERIVGGGLLLEDHQAQMTTAIGLAEKTSYVYFLLVYASLETAIKRKVRWLRWGSGAYEVKQQLGFRLEPNNHTALIGANFFTRQISRAFIKG
jgi:predicted N-acyltransferase